MIKGRLIDNWSFLDYKADFGKMLSGTPKQGMPPMWVGEHFRRIQAYRILEAYAKNNSRMFLDNEALSQAEIDARREYGEPNVLVEQIKSSILGDGWSVYVSDSEDDEAAQKQQDLIDKWVEDDNIMLKILQSETKTVRLGDSVFVMSWDDDHKRPTVEVWDPGFYFPVLDESNPSSQYPEKVHIAYEYCEYEDDSTTVEITYVRRLTWERVELTDERVTNKAPRSYPWTEKREKSNYTVLYSDGRWKTGDTENEVDMFSDEKGEYDEYELDLEIDFIPVVHMPNTIPDDEHFGTSSLSYVLQILDDLSATDTDLQAASATTGSPPIAIQGSTLPTDSEGKITTYGPGTVLQTGEGGATMIDTSKSLDALLKYDDHLLERLSVNGRVPESLLGRVKPNEVPSGIALTLSFAPHTSMINEMRLIRNSKYKILFKFALRYFWKDKQVDQIFVTNVQFGPFLPADKKAAVDLVVQGLQTTPPSISLETAVKMLLGAGFPIDSVKDEVERIRKFDFQGAQDAGSAGYTTDEVREELLDIGPLPDQPLPDLGADGGGDPNATFIEDPTNPGHMIPNPALNGAKPPVPPAPVGG